LKSLVKLEGLALNNCSNVMVASAGTTLQFIASFPNLTALDLRRNPKLTESISLIISKLSNLKHLDLSYCSGLKQLKSIGTFPRMEVLNLSFSGLRGEHLKNLVTLQKFPNLKRLMLGGLALSPNLVSNLISAFSNIKIERTQKRGMQVLSLSNNPRIGEGFNPLTFLHRLSFSTILLALDLKGTGIGDANFLDLSSSLGLQDLSKETPKNQNTDLIPPFPHLEVLGLAETKITEKAIPTILGFFQALKFLDISGNTFSSRELLCEACCNVEPSPLIHIEMSKCEWKNEIDEEESQALDLNYSQFKKVWREMFEISMIPSKCKFHV